MISFIVRCYLLSVTHPSHYEDPKLRHLPTSSRTQTSTIACKDYNDAKDVAASLAGVRECEVCVRFFSFVQGEQPKTVVLPLSDLYNVFADLEKTKARSGSDIPDFEDFEMEEEAAEHENTKPVHSAKA